MTWSRWQLTCPRCGDTAPGGGAAYIDGAFRCAACWALPGPGDINGASSSLYGYQKDGARALAGARAMLLADEPGLGKTAQSLVALDGPAIIVVLPSVRRQWAREGARWAPAHKCRIIEKGGRFFPPRGKEVVIVGYTALRGGPHLSGEIDAGTTLILDEAQAVKNPTAQQTRGARRLAELVRERGGRVLLLTATPAYASPRECWEVLRVAELHRALHPVGAQWELLPAEEQAQRLSRVMLRRRTREVVDLPPVRWQRIAVELPTEVGTALDRAAAEAVALAQLKQEDPDTEHSAEAIAKRAGTISMAEVQEAVEQLLDDAGDLPIATARRLCSLSKLPRAEELAAEHEESDTPLIVLADHRAPVEALERRPRWGAVLGGQSPKDRDATVTDFRNGRLIGMAVNYAAGGTGLDGLQERASRAVLLELPWTPAVLEQALGRLVRIGQTGTSVLVSHLVADHWLDEMVEGKVMQKLAALDGLGVGLSLAGGAVA